MCFRNFMIPYTYDNPPIDAVADMRAQRITIG